MLNSLVHGWDFFLGTDFAWIKGVGVWQSASGYIASMSTSSLDGNVGSVLD